MSLRKLNLSLRHNNLYYDSNNILAISKLLVKLPNLEFLNLDLSSDLVNLYK